MTNHAAIGALTRRCTVGLSVVALMAVAVACSTPPKPKSLVEFEALRNDKYTKRIRDMKDTEELMKASDAFYAVALEAYDDEEMDRVDEYALLGSMRYRTAHAIAKKADYSDRLAKANKDVIHYQGLRAEYVDKKGQVDETVAALEKTRNLQAALKQQELESETDKAAMEAKLASEKQKAEAEKLITEAKVQLAKADGLEAGKFAPRNYGMGSNALKSAEKFYKDQNFDTAIKHANDSIEMLAKSIEEAQPKHAEQQKIVEADKLNKQLFEEADKRFRELVKVDGRGVVITVDSLFKRNQSKIDASRYYDLDFVTELATKYPDHLLMVEGHTDDRGPDARNITVSQARAEAVKDYFLRRGVKADRVQVAGKGEGDPRFPNKGKERNRNNRVDVVFMYNK